MLVIVSWLERKHEVLVTSSLFALTRNFSHSVVLSSSALSEVFLHPGSRLLTLSAVRGVIDGVCLSSPIPPS